MVSGSNSATPAHATTPSRRPPVSSRACSHEGSAALVGGEVGGDVRVAQVCADHAVALCAQVRSGCGADSGGAAGDEECAGHVLPFRVEGGGVG
ncbi:hypothetical protein GS447_08130 [Rhodococcus hoagii]|nr:hypothetical protein [Prescottella equi]